MLISCDDGRTLEISESFFQFEPSFPAEEVVAVLTSCDDGCC